MKTKQLILPSIYPITLAEAKKQCEIDDDDTAHDTYMHTLIMSATSEAEQFLHRRLVSQTWQYWIDCWPWSNYFKIPFGSLQSVSSIKYKDETGAETTWDDSEYIVDTETEPGRIVLGYNESWPTDTLYPSNPIKIEFTCGYFMGPTWATNTAYLSGANVVPIAENGLVYQSGGGTSHATIIPDWPLTIGGTVVDNDITWTCIGIAVPEPIRQAMKIMISDMFEYRERNYFGMAHVEFDTVWNLLLPFKLFGGIIE